MHPILTDRRWLALHVIVWAVTGELISLLMPALFGTPWRAALAFGMPMGIMGGLISLSAWYVSRAAPANWTDRVRPIGMWLLAAVISGVLWAVLGQFWWQALERFGLVQLDESSEQALLTILRGLGALGYLLAIAAYRLIQAFDATAEATRRALQSEVAQREAELRALRAQLDPHFLFNSLNSISGLIGSDPVRAREMCVSLADFLRQGLKVGEASRIPLAREVALVEQYLRVEQVRFGPRLGMHVRLAPDTVDVEVPPLLLQPLVENAVRHGIATLLEGGTIGLETRRAGGHVVITVSNPRDPEARRRGTGLGLDIVRRRLAATFGDHASLTVTPDAESFRAQVTIPVEAVS